jgi:L-2-hydroxyglutarate oxidase LhgO
VPAAAAAVDRVDTVVVGAGVVGLAVARTLAMAGREVVVLEAEKRFGSVTSSRNSEVIHAGIYYPPGSARAALCVRGKVLLYEYCARHQVGHRRLGKLIVAQDDAERAALQRLQAQALANGVADLQWLDAAQARALEPALRCTAALLSPSTGIVDSHGLMLALLGQAEDHGAMLALCSPVLGGRLTPAGIELEVGGEQPSRLLARQVVNSAGLGAPALARRLAGVPADAVPRDHLAKGCYFALAGRAPFSRLVYPAPGASGHLGVHLTLDLAGQARFGPSFRWVDTLDVDVDAAEADGFYAEVRRYWPGLADGALQRVTPGCARRSAARASRRPTSASTVRLGTACRGWSTCSASSRPG